MKIWTFNTNLIDALNHDTSIPDRNLPVYLTNYTVSTTQSPAVTVEWTTVAFLPSYEDRRRVFHLRMEVRVDTITDAWRYGDTTFVLDFSAIDVTLYDINVEGPLSGYGTLSGMPGTWSVFPYVTYEYERDARRLLLHVRDLPSTVPLPGRLYLDIEIKDDVGSGEFPNLFPSQIASEIAKIPRVASNGLGVRVVLPMFICCPDELKTMQLSSIDPELEGAFNPIPEIERLFELQNLPVPTGSFKIDYVDAEALPPSPEPPINWKENVLMRRVSFLLQVLFTVAPECKVIVLYSLAFTDVQQPPFMKWLLNNVSTYDIAFEVDAPINDTTWSLAPFQDTFQFYNNVQQVLYTSVVPYVAATASDGVENDVQYPDRTYRFNLASDFPIAVGGFTLRNAAPDGATASYSIYGPYEAWRFSAGGYCNTIERPPEQYGTNYLSSYGRPDVGAYATSYALVSDASSSQMFSASGTAGGCALLVGLFALIIAATDRRWNFKLILYRKMSSLCTQYFAGQNVGNDPSNRFNAGLYQFWNPIIGMGNVNGSYLVSMCSVIRNFQRVQISTVLRMAPTMSFMNFMPPNPFADLIKRQPTMGPSSIFSLFYVKRVDGNNPPLNDGASPIKSNDVVYFVDITESFALAYASDEDDKFYVVISTVDYASPAQRWILRNWVDPSSTDPLYAFQDVMILPFLQPIYSLTTRWNATGSRVPNSPSISSNPLDVEAFLLCTDPAADNFVDEIKKSIGNDLTGNSYYINVTYSITFAEGGNINNVRTIKSYLTNPFEIGMESQDTLVYQSRNELVQENGLKPVWTTAFDAYPQWVLIPVPCADQNPFAYAYQTELLDGGQYMIFNPILQSYLYTVNFPVPGPQRLEAQLRMQPLTPVLKEGIPFNAFVFRFSSETSTLSQQVFSATKMAKMFSGLNPYTINPPVYNPNIVPPFQLVRRRMYMTTRAGFRFFQNQPQISSAQTNLFFVVGRPLLEDPNETERDIHVVRQVGPAVNFGDQTPSNRLDVEWVFKKYIVSETTPCRLMSVYPYANNNIGSAFYTGASISLLGVGNPNSHRPSMDTRFLDNTSVFWYIVSDETVTDLRQGITPSSTYGLLIEGLTTSLDGVFDPTISQLSIDSVVDKPAEQSIGVFGQLPEATILPNPFPASRDAIRWNATSTFFFSGLSQPQPVSGYLYLFEIYTFYTMTPVTVGSQRYYALSTTPSQQNISPSIQPIVTDFTATQNPTVTFLLVGTTW